MPKSILYLSYDGLNDPLGQSQVLPYLEGLAEKGYGIVVISFEKDNSQPANKAGSKLTVIPLQYHKFPPVFSTLYDLYVLRREIKAVLKTRQIDIIHCRSYITSLAGLWAKRKFGIKFIFDMRGFWADERVEGGLWNLKNPVFKWIYLYFKKKEKEFLLESDAVISLTHTAKKEIEQNILLKRLNYRRTDSPINIEVIPTCADLQLFNPESISNVESARLNDKLGIGEEDFVLLYLGSLSTWYMLEEMIDFYGNLKSEIGNQKKVKFLFVTREQDEVKKAMEEWDLDERDFIITSCQRFEVPKYVSLCDAAIFFILPTYSKKASAATKMGELLAMGKPIITNSGWGDVEQVINPKNGLLIKAFERGSYQKGIQCMKELLETDPKEMRKTAAKHFSLEKGIERYHTIYQELI